ncbi:Rhodanese-like domain-containing protein [Corynascus novoguineensis]|uniref:Rhodanese-like domain-containing protein n=1 Tax=Corynascus novoguineensis TaxID=1126955 RepID=A0AAN7CVB1_9PEZI|nr:Rhodanese-like domain-containing protein [Corynascus novoguineensis]
MATADTTASAAAAPWYAAYPAPKSEVVTISREEVLDLLKSTPLEKRDFVLVDLRRNDFEGGTIRGSINLPAQSLPLTLPSVYVMFKAAGLRKVIFYCGSSTGRGSRATGWLADHIADAGDKEMKSLALAGGIKGWAAAGAEYVEWMDGYDAAVWAKSGTGC